MSWSQTPCPAEFEGEVPAALAVGERRLGAFLAVDVDDLDDGIERPAGRVAAQQRGADQHPQWLAVMMDHPAFEAELLDLAAQHLVEAQHHGCSVVGKDCLFGGTAQPRSGRVAEHGLIGAVDVDRPFVGPHEGHADGRALHHLAQQRAALVEAENLRLGFLDGRGHGGRLAWGV